MSDNRYGNLPVLGSDPRDFYFSSYQHRLRFEFDTSWAAIEDQAGGTHSKVFTWLKYWSVYYQNEAVGGQDDILSNLATEFGTVDVPRTYRPEVQVYSDIAYYDSFANIQSFLNDNSRRCFGQDYIVKAPHINAVSVSITVSRDANFLRYREDYFKTKIANFISSQGLSHTSSLTAEHIKSLIFEEGSNSVNDKFTLLATTRVQNHDGTVETSVNNYIDYLEDPDMGVTPRNSVFLCSAKNISISYE